MYDEDLTNLDDWVRRLKVEYDIYFNGHRKKPPEDLRARVEKLIKKLSECGDLTLPQRFRYNTLVARYYVFRDLWRRTVQEREQSGSDQPEGPEPQSRTVSPLEIHVSISDPATEEEKVHQLYEALLRMRGTHAREKLRLSYPQFAAYLEKQTRNIRERFGCSSVIFTLVLVEDAVKFTAKAENNR